jgi:sterol desaturase/sphingolipid hydroxylase (fatty acid hydroxylase superfamily)
MRYVIGLGVAFLLLLALFRVLELTRPREKRLPVLRPGFWTDLAYWFFQPVVTRTMTQIAILLTLGPIAYWIHGRLDRATILDGYGPASQLPLWLQALAILVIGDFVHYWMHRLLHGRQLWPFHAIHHSSTHLDWLAAVRGHPVNDALMRIATALPVLLIGFAPKAIIAVTPFLLFMAILIHANVDWDWGWPLRWIIASPRFHRWHHTAEAEGRDKNFAALLPVWDLMFGTYYVPKDRTPERFGTDTPVPPGLFGQLLFPFVRSKTVPGRQ